MNWVQFKDPVSHVCPAGAVVACWFVTQEVAGSNTHFLQKCFFKFYRFCRFYRINLGKTLLRSVHYRPQTKLQEGNDFTGVCHSVHGGIGPYPPMGPYPGDVSPPPPGPYPSEPQRRAVRILLECFLVLEKNSACKSRVLVVTELVVSGTQCNTL